MLEFKLEERGTKYKQWWILYVAGKQIGFERYASGEEIALWKALTMATARSLNPEAMKKLEQQFLEDTGYRMEIAYGKPIDDAILGSQGVSDGVSATTNAGQLHTEPTTEEGLKDASPIVSQSESHPVTPQPGSTASHDTQAHPTVVDSRGETDAVEKEVDAVAQGPGDGDRKSPVGRKNRR